MGCCCSICAFCFDRYCKKKRTIEDLDDEDLKPIKPTCCYALRKQCCPCCVSVRPREKFDQDKCCGRMMTEGEGNWENEFVKSFVGFLSGIVLSFLWMNMMAHIVKSKPKSCLTSGVILGVFLGFGLAFSQTFRCFVLLALPSLFSSKGRMALTVLVMVFIVTGPIRNFERNELAISASLTCGQQMIANITQAALKQSSNPATAMLHKLKSTLRNLSRLVLRFTRAVKKLYNLFKKILNTIAKFVKWIGNMSNVCNKKMGRPYTKCKGIFDAGYQKCKDKLPAIIDVVCHVCKIPKFLCNIVKIIKLLCKITAAIKRAVVSQVKSRFKMKLRDLSKMFDYNVTVKYRYHVKIKASKTMTKVAVGIAKDVMKKFEIFEKLKKFGVVLTGLSMIMLVFKAWNYKRKYLSMDRFDNTYISPLIEHIDRKRLRKNKQTILPLNFREEFKYFKITSLKQTKGERKKMIMGFIAWCFTIGTGCFWMGLDYGTYWLLTMIKEKGKLVIKDPTPGAMKIQIEGKGVLADMYRAMVSNMDPRGEGGQMSLDTTPCLPKGSEPDYDKYKVIAAIYGTILFIVFTESYLIRLRHIAVGCYYPQREKSRAVYLYNHILRNRGSFFKFLIRQARRNAKEKEATEKVSIAQRCATSDNVCCRKICSLFVKKEKACLSCGATGKKDDLANFVNCRNYGCDGFYCRGCYEDMSKICVLCQKPAEYGDLSDLSEEQDSSEDEDLKEFYKSYFSGDVEVGYKKGRYVKKEKSEEEDFWKFKKKSKGDDEGENQNTSNFNAGNNRNQSNRSGRTSTGSSTDGLFYDYQFIKEIPPHTTKSGLRRRKQLKQADEEQQKKIEMVTMDIFRTADWKENEGRLSDAGSSADDLDWADSDREEVEMTYQPSYRSLNYDYVV